jgi:hypothetical protein
MSFILFVCLVCLVSFLYFVLCLSLVPFLYFILCPVLYLESVHILLFLPSRPPSLRLSSVAPAWALYHVLLYHTLILPLTFTRVVGGTLRREAGESQRLREM